MWLRTRQAREYCSLGEKVFAKYLKTGRIRHSTLPGGHHRFHKDDLDGFMRSFQTVSDDVKDAADELMREFK